MPPAGHTQHRKLCKLTLTVFTAVLKSGLHIEGHHETLTSLQEFLSSWSYRSHWTGWAGQQARQSTNKWFTWATCFTSVLVWLLSEGWQYVTVVFVDVTFLADPGEMSPGCSSFFSWCQNAFISSILSCLYWGGSEPVCLPAEKESWQTFHWNGWERDQVADLHGRGPGTVIVLCNKQHQGLAITNDGSSQFWYAGRPAKILVLIMSLWKGVYTRRQEWEQSRESWVSWQNWLCVRQPNTRACKLGSWEEPREFCYQCFESSPAYQHCRWENCCNASYCDGSHAHRVFLHRFSLQDTIGARSNVTVIFSWPS